MGEQSRYQAHLASPNWRLKRQARLEIDRHRCQTCLHDGSQWRLEVHHRTYDRLGDEDVLRDLITLCSSCHEAVTSVIRQRRYEGQPVIVFRDHFPIQIRRSFTNGLDQGSIPFDGRFSPLDAQWQARRSAEFGGQGNEAGDFEAGEDRCRS